VTEQTAQDIHLCL